MIKRKSQDCTGFGFTGRPFPIGTRIVNKIVGEITKSKKDMDIINLEDKYILIAKGEKIITVLLVKEKNIQHAHYVLSQVTQKFETFFWDYLEQFESYENILSKTEIFKPMEMLIRGILKT